MKKRLPLGAVLVIALVCIAVTFQVTYLAVDNIYRGKLAAYGVGRSSTLLTKIAAVDELYRSYYIGEINEEALIDEALRGYMSGTGDVYAEYMNAEQFAEFTSDLSGEMVGMGTTVVHNTEYDLIQIVAVAPGSPAEKAGVLPGDLITRVGDQNVSELGYNTAVDSMLGEEGTTLTFTVLRGDGYSEMVEFSVVREKITTQSISSHMYTGSAAGEHKIGVIRITEFDNTTAGQFADALTRLNAEGAEKFVFDVRSNPGGNLDSIVTLLDSLLPEGPIIRIIDKDGNEEVQSSDAAEIDIEAAVLVNGGTASAAELFASALRDYGKAFLVGTQTYGKGSMQTIRALSDGGAIRVTYRKYSPPFSDNYDGVGLAPDVEAELDQSLWNTNIYLLTDENDNQLAAAVSELCK